MNEYELKLEIKELEATVLLLNKKILGLLKIIAKLDIMELEKLLDEDYIQNIPFE